jgi:hypothetical protein
MIALDASLGSEGLEPDASTRPTSEHMGIRPHA